MARPTLFISYRRKDAGGWAQLLYTSLQSWLDRNEIFLDLVELPSSRNFEAELDAAIHSCIGLIALIGPDWLTGICEPNDWVRREIRTAWCRHKPILPVFVGGQSAPPAAAMPPEIQSAILLEPGVHLHQHACPLDLSALVEWANSIPHSLEFKGIRFHRTAVPASRERNPEAFYLSEELLTAGCWATRLRAILPNFDFHSERKSTSAAVTELLLKIERSMKHEGVRDARIDLPFIDELERAALSEPSSPRPQFPSKIVQTTEQLCKHRMTQGFAAMSISSPAARQAGSLITRWTGLSEPSRPLRLVLRSVNEATTHGA